MFLMEILMEILVLFSFGDIFEVILILDSWTFESNGNTDFTGEKK